MEAGTVRTNRSFIEPTKKRIGVVIMYNIEFQRVFICFRFCVLMGSDHAIETFFKKFRFFKGEHRYEAPKMFAVDLNILMCVFIPIRCHLGHHVYSCFFCAYFFFGGGAKAKYL